MEKKEINPIIAYVLANTDAADLEKAIKNYNLKMIVEPHKDYIKQTFFNGDGLKTEAEINLLFDDYITHEEAIQAQGAELEARSVAKKFGKTSDEYMDAAKHLKSVDKKLDSIRTLHEKIQSQNKSA